MVCIQGGRNLLSVQPPKHGRNYFSSIFFREKCDGDDKRALSVPDFVPNSRVRAEVLTDHQGQTLAAGLANGVQSSKRSCIVRRSDQQVFARREGLEEPSRSIVSTHFGVLCVAMNHL